MLWRSRRGRVIRPMLVAAATVAVAFFVVMPVLGGVVVTHKPRAATPSHLIGRAVTLRTSDGVELAARYVPSRNGAAVVVFPGRGDTRGAGRLLARHGYGVLLVDMRGTGASGGDSNAFGWGSRKDLRAAVDFLASRADAVGGIGYSVGGEQLLEAAAYDTRLQAVVSDGAGFRTVREAVRAREGTLPIDLVALWTVHVLSPESSPPPLWDLVARIAPRPLLLIEAGHGQGGEALNGLYARRAGRSAEHWLVPEAHHTGAYEARPREYERRVLGFFGASLLHA
jgi:pimeloyl-ACP methyl ester carboxylesterase